MGEKDKSVVGKAQPFQRELLAIGTGLDHGINPGVEVAASIRGD